MRLGFGEICKRLVYDGEIEALQFVAANTSIPIPRIKKIVRHDDYSNLILEYIEGDPLDVLWARGQLSDSEKRDIQVQLKGFIDQLRELQPPANCKIGSTLQGPGYDGRVGAGEWGPYRDFQTFNLLLRGTALQHSQQWGDEIIKFHQLEYPLKYTHADFVPRNVIVREGKVVAIIDWAFAGWYPEYWEWTKAHYVPHQISDWYDRLDQILKPFSDELKYERLTWTRYPDPGAQGQRDKEGKFHRVADFIQDGDK